MIDDSARLVSRVALGLSYAAHGAQKAFGWFGGPGPQGAAGFMESLGLKPGAPYATAASYGELAAGTLIALGLGGPIGPAILLSGMSGRRRDGPQEERVLRGPGRHRAERALRRGRPRARVERVRCVLGRPRARARRARCAIPRSRRSRSRAAIAAAYVVLAQRDTSPPEGTLATPTIEGARNGRSAQHRSRRGLSRTGVQARSRSFASALFARP